MGFQEAFHRRAPGFVSEAGEESNGRVHLTLLTTVSVEPQKEGETLTFTAYCF